MTPHELAFRHIADNDFQGRFVPRTLDDLLRICATKHIEDPPTIGEAVGAYFDQLQQRSAAALGLCRVCRVRRPTHFHVEPAIRNGRLEQDTIGCTEPYCRRRIVRRMACCHGCFSKYCDFLQTRRTARRSRLRAHGATVAAV